MKHHRPLVAGVFVSFLSLALLAQGPNPASTPHYRLLRLMSAPTVLKRINDVGADGYRVRAVVPEGTASAFSGHLSTDIGATVILERITSPLESFQYLQITGKGGATLQQRLNEAGAQGFRMLLRDVAPSWGAPMQFVVVWMEKTPGPPKQYQYLVIDMGAKSALKATFNPKLWASTNPLDYVRPELEAASQQGYRVVQLAAGATLVMEKTPEVAAAPQADPTPPSKADSLRPYRSLGYSRPAKLQNELNKAAAEGYRIADLNPQPLPLHPAVLLERVTNLAQKYEYLALEAKGLSALEGEINAAAAKGFRLLPHSLRFTAPVYVPRLETIKVRAVMEKAPGPSGARQYRIIAKTNHEALYAELMKAAEQRYHVVGLWNANVGEPVPGQHSHAAVLDLLILTMERAEETGRGTQ